jgi:DNA mismatch endonuclease, patch repair protein
MSFELIPLTVSREITVVDNLTPDQRRKNMQAIKDKNTSLEKALAVAFQRQGWRFRRNCSFILGKPDFVFTKARVIVFVDGDFWHGWRFSQWKHKLSDYWQKKIERNRQRDQYNSRRLRRQGWKVIRIWGHEVERDMAGAVDRVRALLEAAHVVQCGINRDLISNRSEGCQP